MKHYRILLLLALLLAVNAAGAASFDKLWITGSAVPGGKQELKQNAGNEFLFAGKLQAGSFRIVATENITSATRYLNPRLTDSNVISDGLPYAVQTDTLTEGWQVYFADDHYRFTVDADRGVVKGEIMKPWNELFIVGGCLGRGWHAYWMTPMTRDARDPYVFTWTGELKADSTHEEPRSFKLEGQDIWGPKELHPYQAGEDPLRSNTFRHGGKDTKWDITRDGIYTIRVDLFHQTFRAEMK